MAARELPKSTHVNPVELPSNMRELLENVRIDGPDKSAEADDAIDLKTEFDLLNRIYREAFLEKLSQYGL
jgi:hypothetical protein